MKEQMGYVKIEKFGILNRYMTEVLELEHLDDLGLFWKPLRCLEPGGR